MRLIDADELLKPVGSYERVKYTYEYGDVVTVEDIELMQSIDAEPIIKCKDCKHFAIDDIEGFTINGKPLRYAVCKHKNGMRGITAYAYCSRAERKNDETN